MDWTSEVVICCHADVLPQCLQLEKAVLMPTSQHVDDKLKDLESRNGS